MRIEKRLRRKRRNVIVAWFLFVLFAGAIPYFAVELFLGTVAAEAIQVPYLCILVALSVWVIAVGSRQFVKCPFCSTRVVPSGKETYDQIPGCNSCGKAFREDPLDF